MPVITTALAALSFATSTSTGWVRLQSGRSASRLHPSRARLVMRGDEGSHWQHPAASRHCNGEQAPSRTLRERLVEDLGYASDLADRAVEALDGPTDINLAILWLQQHEDDADHGGAVEFVRCPHLDDAAVGLIDPALLTSRAHVLPRARCATGGCTPSPEQWVCLQCGGVHCGRYVSEHALAHHRAHPTHITAASLADLSIHCYACDAYVRHPRLHPLRARLRALKFGNRRADE